MKQNLNSETHFHPVVATKRQSGRSNGCAKSLAELAGMCTPEEVLPSKASAVLLPRYLTERANAVNFAFANFLLGIRVNDEPRQNEAYAALIRIARSVARKMGGYILHSGDWEEAAINCIHQESPKHQELTAREIVQCCEAKKFAYLRKAF